MTQEQQDKLRRALYNAKFTTDAEDENPFVGVYFDDLLAIIEEYVERPIYHEGWLAGEANLAKEYKNIQWVNWIPVEERLPKFDEQVLVYGLCPNGCRLFYVDCLIQDINDNGYPKWDDDTIIPTHWMKIVPPRKEE